MDFQTKRFTNGNKSAYELSWSRDLLANEDIDRETVYNIMFLLDKSGSMMDCIGENSQNIGMNSINPQLPPTPMPILTRTSSTMPNLVLPQTNQSSMFDFGRSHMQSPMRVLRSQVPLLSKDELVSQTVEKCIYLVSELNKTGMNIQVSIVMFDSEAELVYPFKKIDETEYNTIKSNLEKWCDPGGGTEMNKAFKIATNTIEEEKQKTPNSKFHTILLSDGYNNDDKDDELVSNYGSLITSAIGLGEIQDYNHKLFCELAKEDNTYCASNESKLRDYFLQNVFGTTTKVASNLKIQISSNSIVTPHDFKIEKETSVIELETFHSHRKVYFMAPKDTNFTVCYSSGDNQEKCIMFNQSSMKIEDNNDMFELIKCYCENSTKLKEISNEKDVKKQKNRMIDLHKEVNKIKLPETDTGIYGHLNTLINNIKNLSATKETKAYLSCMRRTTRETSSGNYSGLQRQVSMSVGKRNTSVGHTEDCVICYNDKKKTVFRPCGHLVACRDCSIKIINSTKQCPICKASIDKIHEIETMDTTDFMCISCNGRHVSVLNKPCDHANMCQKCSVKNLKNEKECPTCKKKLTRIIPFKSV